MSRGFDLIQEINRARQKGILQEYWESRKPQVLEIIHYKTKPDLVRVIKSKTSLPRDEQIMNDYLQADYGGKYLWK